MGLPSPDDIAKWDAWKLSFTGYIPQVGKESFGSYVIEQDITITYLEWKFNRRLPLGWVAEVRVNGDAVRSIPCGNIAEGTVRLDEPIVATMGSTIRVIIRYIYEVDYVPTAITNRAFSSTYEVTLNGVRRRKHRQTPQVAPSWEFELNDQEAEKPKTGLAKWQHDNV